MVLSTNNERNFFLGNNPYTPDYKTGHLAQRSLAELDPDARQYLESFYRRPDKRSAMRAEATRFIRENPWRTLRRTFNRGLAFWGFDYLASRIHQQHLGWGRGVLLLLLTFEAGSYLLVMALAVFAITCARDAMDMRLLGALLFLVAAYQAPYLVAFSGGTYHFPVMWLVLPIAGVGMHQLVQQIRGSESRSGRALLLFVLLLAAFAAVQGQYALHTLALSGAQASELR